jgi:glycosyltransferase involved in cell wall biosynthesis
VACQIEMSLLGAGSIAIVISLFFLVARHRYQSLPRLSASPESPVPDCMAIIPARNEQAVIARAVCSLPPDTVIVVDDYSEDGTAEAARAAGAGVVLALPLPRNAIGKANACATGARLLTSRWILFTDADTWFEAGFLSAAVALAEAGGISLLSIYLEPQYETLAERILLPYARALFFCGANPKTNPAAMFNGQCLLVRREAYLFLGGHGAAAAQLVEDVKLATLAQRHRLKISIASAAGLGHARMYRGYSGIRNGIERHAFRFAVVSPWLGISIFVAALAMTLWLPALLWLAKDRQWIAAALFALLPAALLRSWYVPLAIYGMLPILLRGLISILAVKPILWKGRTVRAVS